MFSWLGGISTNGLSIRLLNNLCSINPIMWSGNETPVKSYTHKRGRTHKIKENKSEGKHLTFGPRSTTADDLTSNNVTIMAQKCP